MAGTNASFDATEFRDGIELAMTMSLPNEESLRATFHFPLTTSYVDQNGDPVINPKVDQDGSPLDPSIRIVRTPSADPVQVPVAIEFAVATPQELPVGQFEPTRATLTILDRHWPAVQDAHEVSLGGDRYVIAYRLPPIGIFEATIHQVQCYAKSET